MAKRRNNRNVEQNAKQAETTPVEVKTEELAQDVDNKSETTPEVEIHSGLEENTVKTEESENEVKEKSTEEIKDSETNKEVKEETQADTKEVKEVKQTPVEVKTEELDVDKILASKELTDKEKIDLLVNSKDRSISILVKKLLEYNDKMKPPHVPDPKIGAGYQYDLLNTIMYSVLKKEQYNDFRKAFNVLNLVFRVYKEEAFKNTRLHRFDYAWKASEKELKTFNNLMLIISELLDPETRHKKVKEISLEAALSPENTNITPEMASNILRYYGMN